MLQGMLPALAPILPHLAEDAWQSMPWAVPTASVFQSGWFSPARAVAGHATARAEGLQSSEAHQVDPQLPTTSQLLV